MWFLSSTGTLKILAAHTGKLNASYIGKWMRDFQSSLQQHQLVSPCSIPAHQLSTTPFLTSKLLSHEASSFAPLCVFTIIYFLTTGLEVWSLTTLD